MDTTSQKFFVDLNSLISQFYAIPSELGDFHELAEADLPFLPRKLLAHESHMTETVENHHATPVNVEVLRQMRQGNLYAREILLRRHTDNHVVQFGIVRLNFDLLNEEVIREIEAGAKPLGRVLIEHNVLRTVRLERLFKIEPSFQLSSLMNLPIGQPVYGRTAHILCDGTPAVELLEIVADSSKDQ